MTHGPSEGCQHAEAFCLMHYGTGPNRVRIWNSRDGVTPFYIDDERKHENWNLDVFSPWHVPAVGDRVFIDLTLDVATERRRRYVEMYWAEPTLRVCDSWATKHDAIAALAHADVNDNPGAPDILTIENEWQRLAIVASARAEASRLGLYARKVRFA